jgi:hypothetical protein
MAWAFGLSAGVSFFQRHDFIANGGKLTPADNPNAQAIQDELKDIDSQSHDAGSKLHAP